MTVTRFDGTALPSGWTANEPSATSVVVGDGYCALRTDPGADVDSLSGSVTFPEGPLIETPVSGTWDYAVALAAPPNSANGQGVDLLALDQANSLGFRFSQYVSSIGGAATSWYSYVHDTEGEMEVPLDNPPSNLYGPRLWMRMSYDGSFITMMSSHTGKPGTWFEHYSQIVNMVPTSFGIDANAFQPDGSGREQRVAAVVDMTDRDDDATEPPEPLTRTTVLQPDFTDGIPLGVITNGGATADATGGVATLTTEPDTADSYAWVTTEALPSNQGLELRFRFPQPQVQNVFVGIAIKGYEVTTLPASQVLPGKYRPATGLVAELNGAGSFGDIVRLLDAGPIDADENYDGSNEFYGFALKIEDTAGPIDGSTGTWYWMRLEWIDGYFRVRFWPDGATEPTNWQYEGEDFSVADGASVAIAFSHNDSTDGGGGATSSFEFSDMTVYELQPEAALEATAEPFALNLALPEADATLQATSEATPLGLSMALESAEAALQVDSQANPLELTLGLAEAAAGVQVQAQADSLAMSLSLDGASGEVEPMPDVPALPDYCWPIDTSCVQKWDEYPPEVQERAKAMAGMTMRMLTAYTVGGCPIKVRPCLAKCWPSGWVTAPTHGGSGWLGRASGPYLMNGSWFNGCGCRTDCSCTSLCVVHLDGPVGGIESVKIDGLTLDPSAYRVDNGTELVRTDGGCWPSCQDMTAGEDEEGSFVVEYLNARPVDGIGAYAAGILAGEFAAACAGGKCRLPAQVTEIARQGVTFSVATGAFPDGQTGIREVDAYIGFVNPHGLKMRPAVSSVDLPSPRRTTIP